MENTIQSKEATTHSIYKQMNKYNISNSKCRWINNRQIKIGPTCLPTPITNIRFAGYSTWNTSGATTVGMLLEEILNAQKKVTEYSLSNGMTEFQGQDKITVTRSLENRNKDQIMASRFINQYSKDNHYVQLVPPLKFLNKIFGHSSIDGSIYVQLLRHIWGFLA